MMLIKSLELTSIINFIAKAAAKPGCFWIGRNDMLSIMIMVMMGCQALHFRVKDSQETLRGRRPTFQNVN